MKKIFSLLIALCATASLWAARFQFGELYFNTISDTTVEVTSKSSSSPYNSGVTITNVSIPNMVTYNEKTYSVKRIGDNAFNECSSLVSIVIPEGVEKINKAAFNTCKKLTSVTLPNSLTSIGNYAFYGCSSLTQITVPENVRSIASDAFSNSYLQQVVWNAKNYPDATYHSSSPFYGVYNRIKTFIIGDNVEHIPAYLCYCMSNLTSVTIGENVKTIGEYAFSSCSKLSSISIPLNVNKMRGGVFAGCSSLSSLVWNPKECVIDYKVTNTSSTYYPFADCPILSLTLGDSVYSIPANLFYYCDKITHVTLPKSVRSIGACAFTACNGLTKTNYLGNIEDWCNIEFANYDSNPISQSNNFYINDIEVVDLIIPNSIDSIKNYSFWGCSTLKSIVFGRNVSYISSSAFPGCSSIEYIVNKAIVPPTLNQAFPTKPLCYVPCGTLNAYFSSNWKEYCYQFIEQSSVYDVTITLNNASYGQAKVSSRPDCESAIITAIPNEGCTFVKWSDGNTQATRYLELAEDISLTAYFAKEGYTIHVYQDCNTTIE